jgi:hypothetical protein
MRAAYEYDETTLLFHPCLPLAQPLMRSTHALNCWIRPSNIKSPIMPTTAPLPSVMRISVHF